MKSLFFTILFFLTISINLKASTNTENNNKQSNKIILQLQWKNQFQFAGYYMAKEKGFYKKAGFDVEIREFKHQDILKEVLDKKVDFAIGSSDLIIDRSKNKKISLIAAIFQSSPNILLTRKDSKIDTIKELKNRKIMITEASKKDLNFLTMLFSHNISINDLDILDKTYDLKHFVNKNVDVISAYISNEPYELEKKYNIKSKIFYPKDYGFTFYGDILYTHEDKVKNNPQLLKKFKEATLKGWQYAFDNITTTASIIKEKYNTQNRSMEALIYEAKQLKKLAFYNNKKFGLIEKNKIEKIYDAYKLMGMIKSDINFENFIFNEKKQTIMLNQKEINYLKNKKELRLCIEPNWMPYESFDKNGKHQGLSADFFKFFEKQINKEITPIVTKTWSESLKLIKEKKCDILSFVIKTENREKYMNFTKPYLSMPLVLATKLNVTFIDNFKQLRNKKIGMVKDYAYKDLINKKFPNLEFVEFKDTKEGLKEVAKERIFGFIGSTADISYFTQKDFIGELKIAGKFDYDMQLSIGLRNDEKELLTIFDKLVKALPKKLKEDIKNKHLAIKYEQNVNYQLVWKIIIIFLFILAVIFYWIFTIRKEKRKVELLLKKLRVTKNELKNKNKELKQIAITDKLTKLFNRVKLDESLNEELRRARRYNHTFGIIILDIDDFKKINDSYGHLQGDIVLVNLAKILKQHTRSSDICGRWGGEEFLIICPETNIDGLKRLSYELKEKISTHSFFEDKKITCSFGIAQNAKNDTADSLVNKADKALYLAKSDGKNCIKELLD